MTFIRGEAVRWVGDDPQPGLVEVRFTDADGIRRPIVAKTPNFDTDEALGPGTWIGSDSPFPFPALFDCIALTTDGTGDDEIVTVSLDFPYYTEGACDPTEFRVWRNQLGEDLNPPAW
ncbi:hypothetical protein [Kitasatospora sp. NPDC101183]|uniref:hypothetical protein n=1 Tax=Kitasatospora sp. NPDC101183 TaxID=3364100 RepID=UPI0038069907